MENNRLTIFTAIWLVLVDIFGIVVPLLIVTRPPIMEGPGSIRVIIILGCWILAPIISHFIVMPFEELYEKRHSEEE